MGFSEDFHHGSCCLPYCRERYCVFMGHGSQTPWHRSDRIADPTALTPHCLLQPSAVAFPNLSQPQQVRNFLPSSACLLCSGLPAATASGCHVMAAPHKMGASQWPPMPPTTPAASLHSYTAPHLETPLSSKTDAELHLTF